MTGSERERTVRTIIDMETEALKRWCNGDPDGFLKIIADDYTYFDPFIDSRIDGFDAIKEAYDSLRGKVNAEKFELIDPRVQLGEDIAVLTFNFKSYSGSDSGGLIERSHWHATEVYGNIKRRWKLISTHWSFTSSKLKQVIDAGGVNSSEA
jgi:ketosteroid isomerase-like protein